MSPFAPRSPRAALLAASALALSGFVLSSPLAQASSGDRDGDGMPNRWEVRHGLDPDRADARGDRDHDGLRNLGEYRHGGHPRDEDSDDDGVDDGDEVHDGHRGTRLRDRDSDDDGRLDGDEDADRDGTRNEDEDDSRESCLFDDDDRDGDDLDDEDENDHGYRALDRDSDDDGVSDGSEDWDHDGQVNEDDDDSQDDSCDDGSEDADDLLGTITSYDGGTGALVVDTVSSGTVTFLVTDRTEIELDSSGHGSGGDASTDDLVPGAEVAEVDLEDDTLTGELEEIELVRP